MRKIEIHMSLDFKPPWEDEGSEFDRGYLIKVIEECEEKLKKYLTKSYCHADIFHYEIEMMTVKK